jgi:uncharacterized protein YqjF (DUF2071 family)
MSCGGSGGLIRFISSLVRRVCARSLIGVIARLPLTVFVFQERAALGQVLTRLKLTMQSRIFLSAEWRHLVMLNYVVDRDLLQPLVPHGTELDFLADRTFLSVVGFRFLRTRVFGIAFPLHTDFEEVNLRFYVRRKTEEGWHRGVVFVRELVPRRAIAFIARAFYGEPYVALPMRHSIESSASGIRVQYSWKRAGQWESLWATGVGEPQNVESGSEEEFITEHFWGYTAQMRGCSEYQVEHPRWRVWRSSDAGLKADVASLYGDRFAGFLSASPTSAFIADGSPITVRCKSVLCVPGKAQLR